jgi:hypothetical protein
VHVVVLALSLIGISIGWLPRIGWLGLAISAAAVALGAVGLSDKRTGPAGLGYDTAGNIVGGFALPWILALQIKHAGGALDGLLIAWPLERLLAIAAAGLVVFWAALIVGRFRLRAPLRALALAAALAFTAAGTSAWIAADRAGVSLVDDAASAGG